MKLTKVIKSLLSSYRTRKKIIKYCNRFEKYSFVDCECETKEQFQASITRLYHTIEKGLSYENYRAGFGRENIEKLLVSLNQYNKKGFDCSAFFYETALSCLKAYVKKNKEHGLYDNELENRINRLPGNANTYGGTITVNAPINTTDMNYKQLLTSRHSIRHFSNKPVERVCLTKALILAQQAPSACNRQGWKVRIVSDKNKLEIILANQNGNKGFGHEINKILVITADLQAQQRNREVFQAFIDGGMYAECLLNALFYYGIGSVPLSAALTQSQEQNIRDAIGIKETEVFILFIGVGNYPDSMFLTARSERHFMGVQEV